MKNNWQTKKLSEVCDFHRGLTYSKKDEVDFSENIVLRSNNIDLLSNTLNFDELKYINNRILIPDNKKVKKGSIIICTANGSKDHLGKIALIDKDYDYAFGGFMGQLIPNKDIDSKYFFYILISDLYKKHLSKISSGANINNLKFSDLSELQIPLPPLPEQHRIVKLLDEVFENIAKAKENVEKNLQNSKDLFESYLQGVFTKQGNGWEEKQLGEFLKLEYGKPLDKKDRDRNGKFPVYGANGEKNRSDKFYYNKPTIIVGRKGSAGELNLTENKFWPLDVTYFVVFDENKYDLKFIYFLLSTLKLTKLAKGVKPGINRNDVYSIIVSIPNLKEQKSIVTKLDALSEQTKKLEEIYKQKLADLEELKKSVLKKAFSGEL